MEPNGYSFLIGFSGDLPMKFSTPQECSLTFSKSFFSWLVNYEEVQPIMRFFFIKSSSATEKKETKCNDELSLTDFSPSK